MSDGLRGEITDQAAISPAQLTAGHDDVAIAIVSENIGHIHVVGDNHELLMMHQLLSNCLG